MGSKRAWWWGAVSTLLVLLLLDVTPVRAQGAGLSRLLNVDPNDWPMYHRTYDTHRFSPLGQINKTNVKDLGVAWVHQPGAVVQGLESTPIVVDGVLYYSGSYNRVFALDGATGREIWHYFAKLDPVVNTLFFQPYNRGLAVGHGKVFFGTLDGRVMALDMKTGKEAWSTTVLDTKKYSCNFTGAPLVVKDKLIIGQTSGELPIQGKIYALNAANGEKACEFNTIKNRSEEHTSELQSRGQLVCRLLLENKKPTSASVYWADAAPPRMAPFMAI